MKPFLFLQKTSISSPSQPKQNFSTHPIIHINIYLYFRGFDILNNFISLISLNTSQTCWILYFFGFCFRFPIEDVLHNKSHAHLTKIWPKLDMFWIITRFQSWELFEMNFTPRVRQMHILVNFRLRFFLFLFEFKIGHSGVNWKKNQTEWYH